MKFVTGIMPTRGRCDWARKAVDSFFQQTYPHKNLIIIDDQEEPSFPNGAPRQYPQIQYLLMFERLSIPHKRNLAVELATGKYVVHWDSDDWSDISRIADQVERLERTNKEVTGYYSMLMHEPTTQEWRRYVGHARYGLGSSLMYTKSWGMDHPFQGQTRGRDGLLVGEDNDFVRTAASENQYIAADGGSMMVARVHSDNSSIKEMDMYRIVSMDEIPPAYPG